MTNLMPEISIEAGYVLVQRPPGFRISPEMALQELDEIEAACREAGFRKAIIRGADTSVLLTTTDVFHLGKEIAARGLWMAVVESHDAPAAQTGFLEDVVANRGAPLRFFESEADAREWLELD